MKFFKSKRNKLQNRGFTLVEILVAIGVFLVVMTISLGSVVTVVDSGRKSKNLKTTMTNLNFTLEAMSKDIRFGKDYYCGVDPNADSGGSVQNCTGGSSAPGNALSFVSGTGQSIIYRLNNGVIEKSVDAGSNYTAVTSPNMTIEDLKFYVFGTGANDNIHPRVLILIRGYAGSKPSSESRFILQTTVSQRGLDS